MVKTYAQILIIGILVSSSLIFVNSQSSLKWVKVGSPFDLICSTDVDSVQIGFCLWQRLFSPIPSNITNYIRSGDRVTQCGIFIRNVTEEDITVWNSTFEVITSENKHQVHNCITRLMKAVRPTNPKIRNKSALTRLIDVDGNSKQNSMDLKCCSEKGKPLPNLEFYFGHKNITSIQVNRTIRKRQINCITWFNASFTWMQDGQEIICVQKHLTYQDEVYDTEKLNIRYGPKLRYKNSSANVYTVSGNPMPKMESKYPGVEILWKINSIFVNTWDMTIHPNFTVLDKLKLDTVIMLNLTNSFGYLTINVTIVAPSTTTSPVPTNQNKTTPIQMETTTPTLLKATTPIPEFENILVPVAIGLGIFLIMSALIAVMVHLARQRGWFCFKDRVRTYPLKRNENMLEINHVTFDNRNTIRDSIETSAAATSTN